MENNGRGVFYGVIGVATLIVAIVGATFAYFTASKTDDTAITGTTAAAGGLDLAVTPVLNTGSDLIPLNLRTGDGTSDTKDQFESAMASKCVDSNSNNVCQPYKIVVTNLSTTSAVSVRGTLNLSAVTKAANMKWELIDVTDESADTFAASKLGYATINDAGTAAPITVGGNTGGSGSELASLSLAKSDSKTFYVLVWLEEKGDAQETEDAAGSWKGTVEFNAVDASGASTGVTASFSGS